MKKIERYNTNKKYTKEQVHDKMVDVVPSCRQTG